MIPRKFAFILALVLLSVAPAKALDLGFAKEDGGQAGTFLDYAASARSLGMGRAFTGVADDASAGYWNPAGLAQVERKDLVSQYSVLQEETGFASLNYAQPTVDMGTLAVGLVSLRSQNFEKRNVIGERVGAFDNAETAILISHGIAIREQWAIGSTVKMVRHEIDTYSANGYGLDLGGLWMFRPTMQMGLSLRNLIAPKLKLDQTADTYPRDIKLGFKFEPGSRWLIATDLDKNEKRSFKLNLGTEYRFNDVLVLRSGINETEVMAGLGFKLRDFTLDYAFGYHDAAKGVSDLGSSHRFGFHMNFGKRISEQKVSSRWIKRGQEVLIALQNRMDELDGDMTPQLRDLLASARQVIRHQGYLKPQDLYAVQGYVSYYDGEYERSAQSLGEALALDSNNVDLRAHVDKARSRMNEERANEMVATEMKRAREMYEKNDLKEVVKSCEKILSLRPDHVEAAAYLEDAKKRINEPIEREMKIGKANLERQNYFDAIKSFQKVIQMDPGNVEATQAMSQSIDALENQANMAVDLQSNASAKFTTVYEITRDPKKSRSLYSQGLLLYSQGNLHEAAAAWEQAIKLDSENTLARNAFARAQTEIREKP